MLLLKNLLFTFVVPGTVAVYVPLWLAGERTAAAGPGRGVALLLWLLGGAIYAWCVWDFATFGRGTPAPIDAPKKLVVRGLYHYSRNPMYVGVLTVLLGWIAWYGSGLHALYTVFVATAFQTFVMLYEEPHLRGEFGDEYERYTAAVNRWLPRLPG